MTVTLAAATAAFLVVGAALFARLGFALIDDLRRRPPAPAAREALRIRDRDGERLELRSLDPVAFAAHADYVTARRRAVLKRAADISFAAALLLFLSPVLALAILAIKLDSRGPVFYRQDRVGQHGVIFQVLKFRSMVENAERSGACYASVGDARITRVGRILRRFRIDEIPQAVNVLRGEMSFVGPRPERPEFVARLAAEIPHYHARHCVKPGITGWAQVKYEYAASVAGAREKLRYDLFYITRYSLAMDLLIVLLTVRVALFGLGSR